MTCIVQQLKERVNIENPIKPGEIIFYTRGGSNTFLVGGTEAITLKILTPGVTFTNTGYSGETEQTTVANSVRTISTSGICNISLLTKYSLTNLSDGSAFGNVDVDQFGYTPNLKQLYFRYVGSRGDVNKFKDCTYLERLTLSGTDFTLDLANLPSASSCWEFSLKTDGTVPLNNVKGDILYLSRFTALVTLFLDYSKVSGNVSVFESLSAIRNVNLNGTDVSGDVASFANHSGLWKLEIHDTAVTGTLADLLVGTTGLKNVWLPDGVLYTAADLATADARCAANGGTISPSTGHYVNGGTLVDSYPV